MNKIKRFLVLGNWIDKQQGGPKSSIGEISEGLNKEGKPYQITNTENSNIIDETHPVGTILNTTMNFTPETAAPKLPATDNKN